MTRNYSRAARQLIKAMIPGLIRTEQPLTVQEGVRVNLMLAIVETGIGRNVGTDGEKS